MLLSNFSLPVKFYSFRGGNEKFTVIGAGSLFAQTRPPRPTLSRLCCSSLGFATRVSHLAHKTQTRACSKKTTFSQDIPFISMCFNINTSKCAIVPKGKRLFCKILHFFLSPIEYSFLILFALFFSRVQGCVDCNAVRRARGKLVFFLRETKRAAPS